jgi:hypothetical protein
MAETFNDKLIKLLKSTYYEMCLFETCQISESPAKSPFLQAMLNTGC